MKSHIDSIPVYETHNIKIRAQDYNLARIALKRISNPLRFEVPRLRTLDFYLDDELWVILDRSLNDIPIVAWSNFEDNARSNLHEDIPCRQRIYHTHAHLILDKAIEAMQLIIGEKLSALQGDVVDNVSPFSNAETTEA